MSKLKFGKVAGFVTSVVISLSLAGSALALTASDIATLQAAGIINAAQAASLLASIAPVSSGYVFATDLTVGSKGTAVVALQQALVSGGFLVMPAGVSMGTFGPLTKAAVIKYQLSKGISPAAGYVGPKTRASLNGGVSVGGPVVVVPSGTGLSVSLAPTSPSAGAVIAGQAAADLAEYRFTNNTNVSAVVTNVSLMRGGVSADTSLSNVYLFNGAVRLTDSATVSAGKITFNAGQGLFTVPAGSSVTIAVKSDILSSAAAGQTVYVSLTGVTSNVPVSAVYPISASTFTVASAGDISVLTLASTSVSTTVTAGTLNQTIWGASFNATQRFVWLRSLAVKVIGSIPNDSLANLKLYVSGVQVATASGIDANGMITFDLTANPYKIDSSRNLEIRADIVNGSGRTFSVSLQNAADISVYDSNYNVGITANGIPVSTNTITISAGTVSFTTDSTLSSGNVVLGSTNVELARYTLKAYGENEKVSYLYVGANKDLTNVTLYANDIAISSSQNVSSTTNTLFSLGSSLVVGANQTVTLKIKGDLKNSAGVNTATSSQIVVTVTGYTNNAQGSYSSTLTTVPSSPLSGPTMTVVGGGLVVAKNAAYNDTTLTANTNNFKIGSYTLNANSSESVHVTTLVVGLTGTLPLTSLSNLRVSDVNTAVNPQVSNNFGVDFTIPSNGTHTVDVFADVGPLPTGNALATSTGTITITGYFDAGETASTTIGGSVASTSYVTGAFAASTTASQIATQLASLINANSAVSASAVGGVITLTARTAGTGGNAITFLSQDSAAHGAASGTGHLTGGSSTPISSASLTSSLVVTAAGVSSNIDASSGSVSGQTMTVGTGSLGTPTLTSDSPVSQLVIGPTSNSLVGTFTFKATVGQATINELGFNITSANANAITSITVGGVTQPVVVGATTTVTGLNIAVPVSNAGTNIPVLVSYNSVGTSSGGISSDVSAQLVLNSVKFQSGNTVTTNYIGVPTNAMTPVAGYAAVTMVNSNSASLTANKVTKLADVRISIVGKTVQMVTLGVKLTGVNTTVTTAPLLLEDSAGTVVASTTGNGALSSNSLVFVSGYNLSSSATYSIYGTVSGWTGTGDSISTSLDAASTTTFVDVEGQSGTIDSTLIPAYTTSMNNDSSSVTSVN